MHANGKFAELTFAMESCESGSLFEALPKDINVYAITSSNGREDSKLIFCPGKDICLRDEDNWVCNIDGCVSNLFRNKLFSDVERNQEGETLETQYENVRNEVAEFCSKHWRTNCLNESQTVSQYGDINIAKEPVINFLGKASPLRSASFENMERPFAVWSYKDAEMRQLEYRYSMAVARGNLEEAEHYQQIIDNLKKRYAKTDAFLARFAEPLIGGEYSRNYLLSFAPKRLTQLECHDAAVRAFQAKCMPHIAGTAYAVRYASLMAHICERRVPVEAILARIDEFC